MQRSESVGSVTSAFANVRIFEERTEEQRSAETERLRDLLHEKVEEITKLTETVDKLKHDADCWVFAKNKYYRQLGYDTPMELQVKVDGDRKFIERAGDSILNRKGK